MDKIQNSCEMINELLKPEAELRRKFIDDSKKIMINVIDKLKDYYTEDKPDDSEL